MPKWNIACLSAGDYSKGVKIRSKDGVHTGTFHTADLGEYLENILNMEAACFVSAFY